MSSATSKADIEAAREIVVETWLNAGFDPIQYAESIQAVRDGKHDGQTNVKLALAGIQYGRRK
jgi:hypothetical protein